MTQKERILAELKAHPLTGCSNGHLVRTICTEAMRRVRELCAEGHAIEKVRGKKGLWTYRLIETQP